MKKSIRYLSNKIKSIFHLINNQDIFLVAIIILTSLASFGLGRLSKNSKQEPLQIILNNPLKNTKETKGKYVASKKGTRYYEPWCSQVKKINKQNQIWFQSRKEAENRGYLPIKKCKGT